jgi:hypothetical protein
VRTPPLAVSVCGKSLSFDMKNRNLSNVGTL